MPVNPFDNYTGQPPAQAYASGQVTVGTSATLVCTPSANPTGVVITNGAAVVYLGGAAVTSSTGLPVAANATVTVPTLGDAQCQLYAVSASSSVVSYLYPQA